MEFFRCHFFILIRNIHYDYLILLFSKNIIHHTIKTFPISSGIELEKHTSYDEHEN